MISYFRRAAISDRAFVGIRSWFTPYRRLAELLPGEGEVLDLGCGHGLFSLMAARLRPRCRVTGVDRDAGRVTIARSAAKAFANVDFRVGDVNEHFPSGSFAGIAIIDVIHYFDSDEQNRILRRTFEALKPGGVLLLRDVDPTDGVRAAFNLAFERFRTGSRAWNYRAPAEWASTLRALGFSVSWRRFGSIFFSDTLFVARKDDGAPVLTADDWGMSPAVNRGILELARRGRVKRVSAIVDAPYAGYLLEELKALPEVKIGLHFNLTFGKRFRWRGFGDWIEDEFRSQYRKLLELGVRPDHLDGHHHVHLWPGVLGRVALLARAAGIRRIRVPADPSLWRTRKLPLLLLSVFARARLLDLGFECAPCFYPQPWHFRSPGRFAADLERRPGHEVIVHPADDDDFGSRGVADSYRSGRVAEFQAILALGDGLRNP